MESRGLILHFFGKKFRPPVRPDRCEEEAQAVNPRPPPQTGVKRSKKTPGSVPVVAYGSGDRLFLTAATRQNTFSLTLHPPQLPIEMNKADSLAVGISRFWKDRHLDIFCSGPRSLLEKRKYDVLRGKSFLPPHLLLRGMRKRGPGHLFVRIAAGMPPSGCCVRQAWPGIRTVRMLLLIISRSISL
jgi:hypothetical protein